MKADLPFPRGLAVRDVVRFLHRGFPSKRDRQGTVAVIGREGGYVLGLGGIAFAYDFLYVRLN